MLVITDQNIPQHGEAEHNELQNDFDRRLYDVYSSKLFPLPGLHPNTTLTAQQRYSSKNWASANKDLSPIGKAQAHASAQRLTIHTSAHTLPQRVYAAPHKRVVSHALITASVLTRPSAAPVDVVVMDSLREWMGFAHDEVSDCRGTRTAIQRHAAAMQATAATQVTFAGAFPERDEMFEERLRAGESVRELWVDVDRRWRDALDVIWGQQQDEEASSSVAIVGNNRSIQSLLRLVGFPCGRAQLEAEFGILNLQNAAVIPLLVTRSTDPRPYETWERECADVRLVEERMIVEQRERDYAEGEEIARGMSEEEAEKFALLLGPKELYEFTAHRAGL